MPSSVSNPSTTGSTNTATPTIPPVFPKDPFWQDLLDYIFSTSILLHPPLSNPNDPPSFYKYNWHNQSLGSLVDPPNIQDKFPTLISRRVLIMAVSMLKEEIKRQYPDPPGQILTWNETLERYNLHREVELFVQVWFRNAAQEIEEIEDSKWFECDEVIEKVIEEVD